MAIFHEDIATIELENGTIFRSFLNQTIGEGDELANRFGVRVMRNGMPEKIGGTCAGYFIRADGSTVVISNGTVSGNVAYVTLPEACYAVEGMFSLAIKCSGGGVTGTLRIVDGVVAKTTTGTIVDPGTIIDNVEDLIEAIEEVTASLPADYSGLWETLAPNYSDLVFPVKEGRYCTYNGNYYRAITNIDEPETWTSAHWRAVDLGNEITITGANGKDNAFNLLNASVLGLGNNKYTFQRGAINSETGEETFVNTRVRSPFWFATRGTKLTLSDSSADMYVFL